MSAVVRIPRRWLTSVSAQLAPKLSPVLRHRIENAIEALILLLDVADPDPDLEPNFGYLPNGAAADECELEEDRDESEERHLA